MGLIAMSVGRILQKINHGLREVYYRAEDIFEDDMELPISENLVNSLIHRHVTQKVEALEDLHAELYDNWLTLFATISYFGIRTKVSLDLGLTQLRANRDEQFMLFEQKSPSQIHEISFEKILRKVQFGVLMFYLKWFRQMDPVVFLLEKLGVITTEGDLLLLDLNQYLGNNKKIMNALRRFEINQAEVRQNALVLSANVHLRSLLGIDNTEKEESPPETAAERAQKDSEILHEAAAAEHAATEKKPA